MDFVVVGGGPWSAHTNFPTHQTARILSREHRVLYLCRDTHVSLLGNLTGRLPGFHTWSELMKRSLARAEPQKVAENLWVAPLAGLAATLPLSYPPLARQMSVRLVIRQLRAHLAALGFDRPLLWFYWWFFPEIVQAIPHRLAVYDIYDDHAQYDYVRTNLRRQRYTLEIERHVLRDVDLAFAVSQTLVRERSRIRPVQYLPNGVDISVAEPARTSPIPDDIRDLPRPIVGYLGSYDARLDWGLVLEFARRRPAWSFVFVGGGDCPPPEQLPNLYLLGNRPYPDAMRYVNKFDVALIPFVRDALTDSVCPAKLFDYLALGKPIVSTALPAISEIVGNGDEVYRGESAIDFERLAEQALSECSDLPLRRRSLAHSMTWEQRCRHAMDSIHTALDAKGAVA